MKEDHMNDKKPKLYQIFKGEVASVQPYGAFVKIPDCKRQGLVHKSQMSTARIDDPNEMLAKGEMVFCKVIAMENEGDKISLSMKVVNQTTGADQDPNNIVLSQDEKKRRQWKFIGKEKIELGAELNTTCGRCGGRGHLTMDCYVGKGENTYDILPEMDELLEKAAVAQQKEERSAGHKKKKKKGKSKKEKKKSKKRKRRNSSSSSSSDESDDDGARDKRTRHSHSSSKGYRKDGDRSSHRGRDSRDEPRYYDDDENRYRPGEKRDRCLDYKDKVHRSENYKDGNRLSREERDRCSDYGGRPVQTSGKFKGEESRSRTSNVRDSRERLRVKESRATGDHDRTGSSRRRSLSPEINDSDRRKPGREATLKEDSHKKRKHKRKRSSSSSRSSLRGSSSKSSCTDSESDTHSRSHRSHTDHSKRQKNEKRK